MAGFHASLICKIIALDQFQVFALSCHVYAIAFINTAHFQKFIFKFPPEIATPVGKQHYLQATEIATNGS